MAENGKRHYADLDTVLIRSVPGDILAGWLSDRSGDLGYWEVSDWDFDADSYLAFCCDEGGEEAAKVLMDEFLAICTKHGILAYIILRVDVFDVDNEDVV